MDAMDVHFQSQAQAPFDQFPLQAQPQPRFFALSPLRDTASEDYVQDVDQWTPGDLFNASAARRETSIPTPTFDQACDFYDNFLDEQVKVWLRQEGLLEGNGGN